ncbi:MAG TPA: outer membrane beta-barrel protein, partial [Vicinamibacteria bacterium]|nr:outer membrane beta-barrel protein [Vicinamibacteria bacterium]
MVRTTAAAVVAIACAGSAVAGEVAIDLEGGWAELSNARRSAEAVFDGTSGGPTFGAGVRWSVTPSIYVALGGRYFGKDGERAFVAGPGQPSFGLGHPLSVRLIPVHAQAGWRFRPDTSFVPYVGLGIGFASYREESTVGDIPEPAITETKFSGIVSAGLEYGRGSIRFGIDLSYSTIPDSLGMGGISEIYGEDDLGGFTALGRI